MHRSLLTTKFHPPQPSRQHVTRTHLHETLQACEQVPLTIVVAPTGYGKTSLLAHGLDAADFRLAWLTLDARDNKLKTFLTYFVAALAEVDEAIAETKIFPMVTGVTIDIELVLITLANYFSDLSYDVVCMLDDYHVIDNEQIHAFISRLVGQLIPTLHLIISTQTTPPLPIARLRAKRQLQEIGVTDLCFSDEDAHTFMQAHAGSPLDDSQAEHLIKRAEGWVAGLQLALLAVESGHTATPDSGMVPSVAEGHFVNDYLAEEVFEQLPQKLQDFLLKTVIVPHLNGALCEVLTDQPDSYTLLNEIVKRNLFITRLDAEHNWYQYHPLFAEFLVARLKQVRHIDENVLYQRAARWFAEAEDAHTAFDYAVRAADFEQAADIFEQFCVEEIGYANVETVLSWLDTFPEDIFAERSLLACYRAFMMLITGQMSICLDQLHAIENRIGESDKRSMARISAIRSIIACYQQNMTEAGRLAAYARKNLTIEDILFFYAVHIALGDVYRARSDWQAAIEPYKQALGIKKVTTAVPAFWDVNALSALADLRMMQGRLRDAASLRNEAIVIIQDHQEQVGYCIPYMGWIYTRWGELLYEWDRLSEAQAFAAEGGQLARIGGDQQHMLAAYVLMGRILLASADIVGAEEQLQKAKVLIRSTEISAWQHEVDRFQVQIWLAKEDRVSALRWVDDTSFERDSESTYYFESARLGLASILMASTHATDLDRAITLLERIYTRAKEAGRHSVRIEALARLAIAYQRKRDALQALSHLEEALSLAEPEGYRRLFLDLGVPMAQLLTQVTTRSTVSTYAADLLSAFQSGGDVNVQQPLIESLSDRELEVLGLVSEGFKNSDIADALVLSVGTVKKHLSNIYGKLAVNSRTQAVAKARELGLLSQ